MYFIETTSHTEVPTFETTSSLNNPIKEDTMKTVTLLVGIDKNHVVEVTVQASSELPDVIKCGISKNELFVLQSKSTLIANKLMWPEIKTPVIDQPEPEKVKIEEPIKTTSAPAPIPAKTIVEQVVPIEKPIEISNDIPEDVLADICELKSVKSGRFTVQQVWKMKQLQEKLGIDPKDISIMNSYIYTWSIRKFNNMSALNKENIEDFLNFLDNEAKQEIF